MVGSVSVRRERASMGWAQVNEPLLILISAAVTIFIGYVAAVVNIFRRLRAGQLRALTITFPLFSLHWRADERRYEFRTPIGSISVRGEPPDTPAQGYAAKITELSERARKTASDFDQALGEMEATVNTRQKVISELEEQLKALQKNEQDLQDRVQTLSAVEPAAAKEFISLLDDDMSKRERQGIRRDMILFVAGVICTIVVSAIFFALS
jgi:hypothetical protein